LSKSEIFTLAVKCPKTGRKLNEIRPPSGLRKRVRGEEKGGGSFRPCVEEGNGREGVNTRRGVNYPTLRRGTSKPKEKKGGREKNQSEAEKSRSNQIHNPESLKRGYRAIELTNNTEGLNEFHPERGEGGPATGMCSWRNPKKSRIFLKEKGHSGRKSKEGVGIGAKSVHLFIEGGEKKNGE